MRRIMFGTTALLLTVACGKILEPTPIEALRSSIPVAAEGNLFIPAHHNIPATFEGQEGGPIIWLCATQLRNYEGVMVEDHYLRYSKCPLTPIE